MKKLDLKAMVTCAALIAAAIVLSRFLSINAWNLKIGFTFVPVFIAAYLYGTDRRRGGRRDCRLHRCNPVPDRRLLPGLYADLCDHPAAVYGLLLHRKQTPLRILIAIAIVQLGCGLLVNTYWISVLVRLTVYGTFGDAQCAVFDHDSGRVYRHRCDEPPARAA